jgi:Zn-dependent metalloprotease
VGSTGAVRAAMGRLPRAARLSAAAVLDAAAASAAAVSAVAAATPDAEVATEDSPELVAFDDGSALVPAWAVTLSGDGPLGAVRRQVFIDASSGALLHQREGLLRVRAQGSGFDVHGRRRDLDIVREADGEYALIDEGHGIQTYTALGRNRMPGRLLRSDQPDHWDEGVFGAGAAVDAHVNAGQALDYFAVTFKRRSLDGHGGTARIVVHAGAYLDNAYWDGRNAVFGDGDGKTMAPLSSGMDVVAHELFHGVTQSQSGLLYEGESGALNESLSDVFACLVEMDRNDGNWTIGEDVAARPLRDLADPAKTGNPAHMSRYVHLPITPDNDMGGVHMNSTIPSHAAFLVSDGGPFPMGGGVVTAIGDAKMQAIWWRAASVYLGPRARFADFAAATRAAAEDLYGDGPEVATVDTAWRAVGVIR